MIEITDKNQNDILPTLHGAVILSVSREVTSKEDWVIGENPVVIELSDGRKIHFDSDGYDATAILMSIEDTKVSQGDCCPNCREPMPCDFWQKEAILAGVAPPTWPSDLVKEWWQDFRFSSGAKWERPQQPAPQGMPDHLL